MLRVDSDTKRLFQTRKVRGERVELKKQTPALTWNLGGRRAAVLGGGGRRPAGTGLGNRRTVARTFPTVNCCFGAFSLVSLPLNMFVHLAIFYYLDHLRTSGFPTNRCGASSP